MEFVKVMKIYNRMCKKHMCHKCPLGQLAKDQNYANCSSLMRCRPELAKKCLVEWNKEHPVKTYATDFFEKYPNAPKEPTGEPKVCLKYLVCGKGCSRNTDYCMISCAECWNQPLEE